MLNCMKMLGRCTSLKREMFYCFVLASMAVLSTASAVKRDECGFLHGISTKRAGRLIPYLTEQIKRHCTEHLRNGQMQYNCNQEETASLYADMKDLRSNEIQLEMYAHVWETQQEFAQAIPKFVKRGLCTQIKEENLTDYGCASAKYAYRSNTIPGGGMRFKDLLICKFDAPKSVIDFFK
ncbi:unnamed protein product [Cylicocyclus nassatus]|uniref:Uncharacterized protein n=1 Tax=Cylicocyclus nassatus TaxID=53992 RepID=A0AA36MB61_CYLNA|nr:unnamed protein product [Cylicocyclus nassatus]